MKFDNLNDRCLVQSILTTFCKDFESLNFTGYITPSDYLKWALTTTNWNRIPDRYKNEAYDALKDSLALIWRFDVLDEL